jgi:pimeloyl-ACP methyl ester carboxylesterase
VSKVSHLVRTDAGLTRKLGGRRPCDCQTIEVEIGRVRYARNGDVRLAYRILGDGDTTLVWVPGWISNVDLLDEPQTAFTAFFEQLAEETRFIVWDKRGTGLSDPVTHVPPLDERMDDLRAVMDAVEAERPALFGVSEGGPMSILFAATYPERVQSLVLHGTLPRYTPELPDYPWGFTAEKLAAYRDEIETHWGEGALAALFFGPIAEVPGFRDYYGRIQRLSTSPTMALMLWDSLVHIDVRAVLNTIRVPTLVLARNGDLINTVEAAAAWAEAIPGAKFEELPPGPHGLLDDALASAVLDFACGTHPDAPTERVLSAVLFTDIVGSTELLSVHGDAHWRHSDGDRLQQLRAVLPCEVRVVAETHPLFGRLLAARSFKRWNGALLLVVELPDGSPGTVRADATDVFGVGGVEGAVSVFNAAGLRELHRLTRRLLESRVSGFVDGAQVGSPRP